MGFRWGRASRSDDFVDSTKLYPGEGALFEEIPSRFSSSDLVARWFPFVKGGDEQARSLIYRPDTALPAFQTFTPIIKRPHLDEIAKVIDSFLMAVSCTLSPSHFVRFSFSTQMSRVQPSQRNRNATKLETDKEGAPAGIRIYNNRSFGGPAWWWQVWFIRGNLVAIYDDRVNRLRVTSISVTGMAADNSRTCVSFHRSLTAMVTRCCERRNQDYMNIWTLVAI